MLNIKYSLLYLLLGLSGFSFANNQALTEIKSKTSAKTESWSNRVKQGFKKIVHEGNTDLYFTGYAWHNRYMYDAERIATNHYNEAAWGGGIGRGYYDEDGDWHSLYGLVFLDSHRNAEPWGGYGFLKIRELPKHWKVGGGFTVALTRRPDILNGYPFPAAAPLINVSYRRLAVFAAYVPGGRNIGNVLFVFGRWSF